jgi:hypothetical protein
MDPVVGGLRSGGVTVVRLRLVVPTVTAPVAPGVLATGSAAKA